MTKSLAETIPVPTQSDNQDAADGLNEVYNNLLNKRTDLLEQLDDNRRQMDDILLEIRRLETADEPEAEQ